MKNKGIKDLELYNEAQRWWVTIRDNCVTTIDQFENSIRLQKEIKDLAEKKIIEEKGH